MVKDYIGPDTIIVGEFNTWFSHPDRSMKLKTSQDPSEITYTYLDFTDIYGTFHTTGREFTFFSLAYGTFSKIEHIIGPIQSSIFFK